MYHWIECCYFSGFIEMLSLKLIFEKLNTVDLFL